MRIFEITYMGPLGEEVPTQLERVFVLETEPGQISRQASLLKGREISLTAIASTSSDFLPNLIDLGALDENNSMPFDGKQTH